MIAFSLALIVFCGYRIGVHYGAISQISLSPSALAAGVRVPLRAIAPRPAQAAGPAAGAGLDSTDQPALRALPGLYRPAVLRSGTWVPILMYHYVRTVSTRDRTGYNLSVTREDFERQMIYLRDNGFNAITMRDLDIALVQKHPLPNRPVVITFDDGYADFYTTAAPVLRSVGLRATEYIPTELIGQPGYMTWNQVRELDSEGIEMGAHTMLHVDLTRQTTARAELEITGSKSMLEDQLGHPVVDFAYPSGRFNLDIMRMVRDNGLWSAVTTQYGAWHDAQHMFDASRTRVSGGESLQGFVQSLLQGTQGPSDFPADSSQPSPQPARPIITNPTRPAPRSSPSTQPSPGSSPTG